MTDMTEDIRKAMQESMNKTPRTREELEKEFGQVWDTGELSRDFSVMNFMAPFVIVTRKSDQKMGSLMFQHHPRFYFSFEVA